MLPVVSYLTFNRRYHDLHLSLLYACMLHFTTTFVVLYARKVSAQLRAPLIIILPSTFRGAIGLNLIPSYIQCIFGQKGQFRYSNTGFLLGLRDSILNRVTTTEVTIKRNRNLVFAKQANAVAIHTKKRTFQTCFEPPPLSDNAQNSGTSLHGTNYW